MSQTQKQKDLLLGNYFERMLVGYLNSLEVYKRDPFKLSPFQYNIFDLKNKKITAELKTRRVSKERYPDTMIGHNKICRALCDTTDMEYQFFFIFTDGLYVWDFHPDEYSVRKGGRTDRGKDEIKDYAFIPTEFFRLLTTEIKSVSQVSHHAHSTSEISIS